MITRISIPIQSPFDNTVFFQNIYFEGSRSPTKYDVISTLRAYCEKAKETEEFTGTNYEWQNCIDIVNSIPDSKWHFVSNSTLISVNIFVDVPDLGSHPFTWSIINPQPITSKN